MRALWVLGVCALGCASTARSRAIENEGTVLLTVVNRLSERVCYLYLSSPNEDEWGSDLLGSDSIAPQESLRVRFPPGQFDLRVENCQHETSGVLRGARITRATTLVLQ